MSIAIVSSYSMCSHTWNTRPLGLLCIRGGSHSGGDAASACARLCKVLANLVMGKGGVHRSCHSK